MTQAFPVKGNRVLRRSDLPGERFSTMEIARAKPRASPERTAEIRAEWFASKLIQCKAEGEERHAFGE
jgi:hypothetical protein